jgi:hypothetical protein
MPSQYTPAETEFLRANLLDLIASGVMPSDACERLHINWREYRRWLRTDTGFAADLRDAEAHLADTLAARATRAHETLDHKSAMVAVRSWQWTAEKLAPKKYGEKLQIEDVADAAELRKLLKEAIERACVVDSIVDPKTIDVTAMTEARRLQRLERSGPPLEGA